MADADDEYERERQENIRKNQELLLSLGLNVSVQRRGGVGVKAPLTHALALERRATD